MKKKSYKQQEYLVISEYGYFVGLRYGGIPQWSYNVNEAKPLNHMNKFYTLKAMCQNLELIFESI